MDIPAGMILRPGNMPGWWDFPIRDRLSFHLGMPVTFANDANAAAYGEFWRGAGAQHDSMVLLTLGTGIGGGIIIGDMLVEGAHSCGGECGHILVNPAKDAWQDSLGNSGSLEAYANARRGGPPRDRRARRERSQFARPSASHGRSDHAADGGRRSGTRRRAGPQRRDGNGPLAGDRHRDVRAHDRSGSPWCSAGR